MLLLRIANDLLFFSNCESSRSLMTCVLVCKQRDTVSQPGVFRNSGLHSYKLVETAPYSSRTTTTRTSFNVSTNYVDKEKNIVGPEICHCCQ